MSRSNYNDDCDGWRLIRWRGAVASAIRGARGQAFLREMLAALDAMPNKRLIAHDLINGGEVCAIGCVGAARGVPMDTIDPEDYDGIASTFGISPALVREIESINDEDFCYWKQTTPEARWRFVREWVVEQLGSAHGG